MPLSPSEQAALRDIERSFAPEKTGPAGLPAWISRPLLIFWVAFVVGITGLWIFTGNPAALVLAISWAVLLAGVCGLRFLRGGTSGTLRR